MQIAIAEIQIYRYCCLFASCMVKLYYLYLGRRKKKLWKTIKIRLMDRLQTLFGIEPQIPVTRRRYHSLNKGGWEGKVIQLCHVGLLWHNGSFIRRVNKNDKMKPS